MLDGFSVDTNGLDDLGKKLRFGAVAGQIEVDKALIEVADLHKTEAERILSEAGVTSIGPIRVQPLPGAHTVRVVAPGTALAWVYERGNKGNRRSKTFTHPVFGQVVDPPVQQQRHPFFSVARRRLARIRREMLSDAWAEGLKKSGIRVD